MHSPGELSLSETNADVDCVKTNVRLFTTNMNITTWCNWERLLTPAVKISQVQFDKTLKTILLFLYMKSTADGESLSQRACKTWGWKKRTQKTKQNKNSSFDDYFKPNCSYVGIYWYAVYIYQLSWPPAVNQQTKQRSLDIIMGKIYNNNFKKEAKKYRVPGLMLPRKYVGWAHA